jgi:hypothetical protein
MERLLAMLGAHATGTKHRVDRALSAAQGTIRYSAVPTKWEPRRLRDKLT